jgi:hypothetical protein
MFDYFHILYRGQDGDIKQCCIAPLQFVTYEIEIAHHRNHLTDDADFTDRHVLVYRIENVPYSDGFPNMDHVSCFSIGDEIRNSRGYYIPVWVMLEKARESQDLLLTLYKLLVRRMTIPKKIVAAAIKLDGTIYALAPPARHDDILQDIRTRIENPDAVFRAEQGFIDDQGRFWLRRLALRIARDAGQLIREPLAPSHGLFSEDVW